MKKDLYKPAMKAHNGWRISDTGKSCTKVVPGRIKNILNGIKKTGKVLKTLPVLSFGWWAVKGSNLRPT